jgi:hypothetical protein
MIPVIRICLASASVDARRAVACALVADDARNGRVDKPLQVSRHRDADLSVCVDDRRWKIHVGAAVGGFRIGAAIAGVRILPLVGAGDVVERRAAEARLRPRFFIGLQTVCKPLIKR